MSDLAKPERPLPVWQRQLFPAGLLESRGLLGGPSRRSARDWAVDVAMFLTAIGVGTALLISTWPHHSTFSSAVDIALGVVACLSLWWRRGYPTRVATIAVLASVISSFAGGAGLLALFNCAIRGSRTALAWLTVVSLIVSVVYPAIYPGSDPYLVEASFGALLTIVVVGWGLFVRARRELVYSLRERAERLEAEQRIRIEQAREAERRRIAREMHDVLAHRVSLLSVHAGALEFRPDASPGEIAEAAAVIRASAHAAMQELRDVVGVLRDGDGQVPEPPQPTLADLPALVDECRAAGMRVSARVDVDAGAEPPASLGRTAYRVVQEGLTNARKHAPGARVDVRVSTVADAGLMVEVLSRRPIAVAATTLPGTGTGLIGLTERVELAGGELDHGLDQRGDFTLRAVLPWQP